MLINPFTPSTIASSPEDFFGRRDELRTLERSIAQGSVAIQGPIGIGKSSLLAYARLRMEGFESGHKAETVLAVGDKDADTIDKVARLLLECLIEVDEAQRRVKFKLGPVFEFESTEITRNFTEGRHLAILKRVVERDYLSRLLNNHRYLILAIDEADKCPVALARLIRSIETHTQQQGVTGVRFALAGVSPFFRKMVDEDQGIARFFYKTISLQPLTVEEATDLVETKLCLVANHAEGLDLRIDPGIVRRVVELSGGHPHLIQLLGSHLIEHEDDDPDGIIDSRDLYRSLRRICYEDRARLYDSTLELLDLHGHLDVLRKLLDTADDGFPTRISRGAAAETAQPDQLHWLVERNVIAPVSAEEYALVDEFLRVRILFDEEDSVAAQQALEQRLIERRYSRRARGESLFEEENLFEGASLPEDEY